MSFAQEYLCVDRIDFNSPLSVLLRIESGNVDVTKSHLFLGYKPLVIGLVVKNGDRTSGILKSKKIIELNFRSGLDDRDVAVLSLENMNQVELGDHSVLFYKGIKGIHTFLGSFHQWINQKRVKKPNMSLEMLISMEMFMIR